MELAKNGAEMFLIKYFETKHFDNLHEKSTCVNKKIKIKVI